MITNLWLCVQDMIAQNNNPATKAVMAGNEYILRAIPEVEDWIENRCEMAFVPQVETITMDYSLDNYDIYTNQLYLRTPFLEITSVKVDGTTLDLWDGQASTRADSDYYVRPKGQYPIHIIQGLQDQVFTPSDVTHYQDGIEITGITGYHTNYPRAWKASGAAVSTLMDITTTSLVVNDASGIQFDGSPRFSEGQLLRIGTEFMTLWSMNANTLTVERGVLGSTAAAHAVSASVEVWHAQPQIQRAATRWAVYMAKRRANFDSARIDSGGGGTVVISTPAVMPEEVAQILTELSNPYNKLTAI